MARRIFRIVGLWLVVLAASAAHAQRMGTIAMGTATRSVDESAGTFQLQVIRAGSTTMAATVAYAFTNGTAVNGTHYNANAGALSWLAGDATPKTISIAIVNDAFANADRSFSVTLSGPVGANLGTPNSTIVTIVNDDTGGSGGAATLAFAAADYSVAENAGTVTLTVNRAGPVTAAASVRWTTASGTAIAGTDFGGTRAGQSTGMLSWTAGDSAAKSIVVPIKTDALSEPDEDFFVNLSDAVGATLGTPASARVVILGDLTPPPPPPNAETELGFAQAKYLVLENAGSIVLSVNRSALPTFDYSRAVSVSYATQVGAAQAGSDFTPASGTLNWVAGESGTKTIVVPIANDAIAEPHETFKVSLSAPSTGARLGAIVSSTVIIVDDDEVFPPHGAMPDNWTIPVGATTGWHVSSEPGLYEGFFALRTDTIRDNQTARIEVNGYFAAGKVVFRVRVSSEANADFLRFYVDGEKRGEWSGTTNTAWQIFSVPLAAGSHNLRWSYEKDGSASLGQDAAWLDAVTMPAVTP